MALAAACGCDANHVLGTSNGNPGTAGSTMTMGSAGSSGAQAGSSGSAGAANAAGSPGTAGAAGATMEQAGADAVVDWIHRERHVPFGNRTRSS